MSRVGIAMVILLTCRASAEAPMQVQVTLPLDGYFRVGRYMPVHLRSSAGSLPTITISGDDVLPATVVSSSAEITVPVLILGSGANELVISSSAGSQRPRLRPLSGNEDITVTVNPALQGAGPAIAFELLETVDVMSPSSSIVGEDAYLPARGWIPGMPAALRRQIILAGALLAIAVLACALLRGWTALGAVALVTLGGITSIALWSAAQSPLRQLMGQIAVEHDGARVQWDQWTYFTSTRRAAGSMPFNGAVRPMLVDAPQAQSAQLRLIWSDDESQRRFEFVTEDHSQIAFLSRFVTTELPWELSWPPTMVPRGAFAQLARRLYLRPGWKFAGEIETPAAEVVVIRKS